jgi:hypothetical protein
MSSAKKILSIFLICVLFFGLFEASLRLAGFRFYPSDLRFILDNDERLFVLDGGSSFYVTNPKKARIFIDQKFPVEKKKNTFRIFILGESVVNYLGKFGALKEKLRSRYPSKDFEIINVGGLSYGSSRLLIAFPEILEYNPDLIILYSGNNEFEEDMLRAMPKENFLTRLNNKFLYFRAYQLISKLYADVRMVYLRSQCLAQAKQPSLLFSLPSPNWNKVFGAAEKNNIYAAYQKNIETMATIARAQSVKLIISTVAYNQIGSPPFRSLNYETYEDFRPLVTPEKISEWLRSDIKNPFVEYAIGEFFYQERNFPAAKRHLIKAFILDASPHRANQITNDIIRKIAAQYTLILADVESAVAANSEGGIISQKFLSDHCHFYPEKEKQLIVIDEFYDAINKSGFIF